jgi:hypothetical protein
MVVAVLGLLVSQASADLIIDVSLAGGGKAALINPGETVDLEVRALIVNSPGDNGFQSAEGSLMSGIAPLKGDLHDHVLQAPFVAGRVGTHQDLPIATPDGDLDYGQDGAGNGDTDLVWYRSATPTPGDNHLLGTLKFTASSLVGETTEINFMLGVPNINANPLWQEDGAGLNARTGVASVGAPVVVEIIPEPGTLILLGMGALVLLARRRRR